MQSCLALIPEDIERVYLAYSGGLDSSVLLHLLVNHRPAFNLVPWHINHGLLAAAGKMQDFCVTQAARYDLKLRLDHLELDDVDSNIEAEARRQRYALFESCIAYNECLLTAHHADDQAETFLLNALRGSGSAGLRGIARRRQLGQGLLLRPLLEYSRAQLEDYANQHELAWCNDPSNRVNRFDRNYLRNQVIPSISARWPHYQVALATTSRLQAETQTLLDEIAQQDFSALAQPGDSSDPILDLDGLLALSVARRKNLLRFWVARAGLASIPGARLDELVRQLLAKPDAMPSISLPGYSIRLYDRRLFLVRDDELRSCSGVFAFDQNPVIEIEPCNIRISRSQLFEQLQIDDDRQSLSIRFRTGEDTAGDRHRLKRLFQKKRVPPWRRDSTPLVYLDDELRGLLR